MLENALATIETFIATYPALDHYARKLEENTGVRCGYLVLGLLFAPFALYFMPVLLNACSIAYPVVMSVKAIDQDKSDRTRWLMYWLFFNTVTLLEPVFMSVLTGFTVIKFAYLTWCMAPMERNGCVYTYKLLQPLLQKHMRVADGYVAGVTGRVEGALQTWKERLADAAVNGVQAADFNPFNNSVRGEA